MKRCEKAAGKVGGGGGGDVGRKYGKKDGPGRTETGRRRRKRRGRTRGRGRPWRGRIQTALRGSWTGSRRKSSSPPRKRERVSGLGHRIWQGCANSGQVLARRRLTGQRLAEGWTSDQRPRAQRGKARVGCLGGSCSSFVFPVGAASETWRRQFASALLWISCVPRRNPGSTWLRDGDYLRIERTKCPSQRALCCPRADEDGQRTDKRSRETTRARRAARRARWPCRARAGVPTHAAARSPWALAWTRRSASLLHRQRSGLTRKRRRSGDVDASGVRPCWH